MTNEAPLTVLVVDDEPGVRVPIVRALRRHGYSVLEAEHGPAALARSEEHDAPIDLLVTDVMMPTMNGRELAKRMRARLPELLVLFMSGYTDDHIDAVLLEPDNTGFIEKPFQMAGLVDAMEELLERTGRG